MNRSSYAAVAALLFVSSAVVLKAQTPIQTPDIPPSFTAPKTGYD